MRILNRPMFRYGGPIREGIMHGMRNGGRAALVGNPVYPKTDGREHHSIWKTIFGAGAKPAAGIATKPGFIRTQAPKAWQKIKSMFGSTTPVRHTPVTRVPGGPVKNTWGINTTTKPSWKPGKEVTENIWSPNYLGRTSEFQLGKKIIEGSGYLGKPIKAGAQFLYRTPTASIPLVWFGGKWLLKDGTPAPDQNEINNQVAAAGDKWDPGAGGEQIITQSMKDKIAKDAQNKRMKSYLDMMGYDSAKKTAMGDALIDASALVQDATTEAGSLKKADWGKMINKMIQATSKRLDKPEQIREAVGLMSVKAAIEKDMTAEEDALKKIATKLQIKIGQKTLEGNTFEDIISDRMIKNDMLKGDELASLFRIKKNIDAKVISTAKMGADQDALTYVANLIADKKAAGTPYPPGHYIISDRIVKVDEEGNMNKVL